MRNNDAISVKAAASLTANILRSGPMYVQTLLGGMDGDKPSLYSLDPAGGMIEDTYISTGSGSIVAYGVLEDRFRDDLTTDEGIEIAIRAIRAAAERFSCKIVENSEPPNSCKLRSIWQSSMVFSARLGVAA